MPTPTTRNNQKRVLLLCIVILGAVGQPADASIQIFTDRASWQTAAGGGTGDLTENFNSFTTDANFSSTSVTSGFLTLSSPFGGDVFNKIDASPFHLGDMNGTTYATLRATSDFFSTLFTFSEPVAAVGFDYVNLNIVGDMNMTTSLGEPLTLPDTNVTSFFGVVYDAGETITSIHFTAPGNNLAYSSDNWEAFSTAPIPEPTTHTLALAALCLAMSRRRIVA